MYFENKLIITVKISKYPHFGFKFGEINAFLRNRYIVEFSFLLSKKLEPPARGSFDKLRYTKGKGSHKIVSRRSIPIPYFNQQPPIFILGFKVADSKIQLYGITLYSLQEYFHKTNKIKRFTKNSIKTNNYFLVALYKSNVF